MGGCRRRLSLIHMVVKGICDRSSLKHQSISDSRETSIGAGKAEQRADWECLGGVMGATGTVGMGCVVVWVSEVKMWTGPSQQTDGGDALQCKERHPLIVATEAASPF